MTLGRVQIKTRADALIWQVCDDVKTAREEESDEEAHVRRAAELCRRFELDLYRDQAEAVLTAAAEVREAAGHPWPIEPVAGLVAA